MSFEKLPIDKIPSEDIAIWLAKLNRIQFALTQQRIVTGEDGQCAIALADPYPEPSLKDHWTSIDNRAEAYECVMLYELAQNLSLNNFRKAVELPLGEHIDPLVFPPTDREPSDKETSVRANILSNQALLAAFGRLGMIQTAEDNARSAPNALIAAFMYQRADIRQESDRSLFGRATEITGLKRRIEQATPPRTMGLHFRGGESMETSVYQGIIYDTELAQRATEESDLPVITRWWQEVAYDFGRIEQVAIPLAA